MAPSLLVESGDFLAEVARLRSLAFGANSGLYVSPAPADLSAFQALADALLAGDALLAVSLADPLGYEVVRFTDTATGRVLLGTRERLLPNGNASRGWGSYFVLPRFATDALVEVPHVLFDSHTEELGARSFLAAGARGFLLAGAHRNANGTGTADVAHLADSIFQQVHRSWIGAAARTDSWQVHGFDDANHAFPAGTDAVLSNGDGSVSAEVQALDQALQSRGWLSYAYNTLDPASPLNVAVNDGLAGTSFSSLGGTTNRQGQLSRSLGGRFIHAEFEQSLRFTSPERMATATALAGAIAATSSFQVSGSSLSEGSSSVAALDFGSLWAYKADGSNQGTAWRADGFDASSWATGRGQLGYGDGDETTVVPSGPSGAFYITTYFRSSFDLADPAGVQQLDLSVIRDDGLVLYLNGVEVLRNNIAANPTYTTLATSAIAGADETTPIQATLLTANLPAGLLRQGRNELAAEIHQSGATSSDISFDARLAATSRQHTLDVDLDAPLDAGSLQASDLLINGSAGALAAAVVDADTVRFTLPLLAAGSHILELPAGSLQAADGTALGAWSRSVTIAAAPQYTLWQTPRLQLGDAPLTGYAGSSTDQVEVLWQTRPAGGSGADRFTVDVRLAGTQAWSPGGTIQQWAQPVDGRIVFSSRLAGLEYARDYEYRVQHWSGDGLLATYGAPFRTRLAAGDKTPFSFVAYGDSADPATIAQFRSVQSRINSLDAVSPLAFALLLGDNTYSTGTHGQLDSRFVPSLAPEATAWNARRIDYAAFGNHDVMTDGGGPTEASFSSPIPVAGVTAVASAPAGERPEHNYSFDVGDVHIATFDSNSYANATRLDAQLDWLEADLAASRATWKIVVAHHPVAGSPDKPESAADNYYQQMVSRLRAAGVDLLLSGHTHTYHQSYPLLGQSGGVATYLLDTDGVYDKGAGLVQVAIGTGGTALRSGSFSANPFIRAGFSTSTTPAVEPGFGRLDVTPETLTLSYVAADDGAVLSTFTIRNTSDPSLRTSSFQQGANGYLGSVDTMVRQASPGLSYGSASSLNVDGDDPAGSGQDVQALLRFADLFGAGVGQIPLDATLVSASLRLSVSNAGNALALHRLLQPWDGNATWDGLGGGLSTDGVEALAQADGTTAAVATGTLVIDVLASLRAWQGGAANLGWLLQPGGADGVDFASAEAVSGRPQLEVQWRPASGPPTNLPPTAVSLSNPLTALAENTPISADLKLADIAISDDGQGTNTLTLLGSDAGQFLLQGQALYLKAGMSLDYEQRSSLSVTIQAEDTSLPAAAPVTTAYTLAITNLQEGAGSAGVITTQGGAPVVEGVTLQAGVVSGDPDDIASSVTVDWLLQGVPTGHTGATVTVGATQAGSWQARHTYTDGAGTLTQVESPALMVEIANNGIAAFSITGAAVPGSPAIGERLVATQTSDDSDGNGPGGFSYLWQSSTDGNSWSDITNALSNAYTIVASDEGRQMRLRVSYTDNQNHSEIITLPAGIVPHAAPLLSGFSPADGETAVAIGTAIALTFNEPIQRGIGSIEIRVGSPTGALVESFDAATSLRLSISGTTLTIDPTADLASGTQYFVVLPSGSVKDLTGTSFAGTSSYDFTTAAPVDVTPPRMESVAVQGSKLLLQVSEPITTTGLLPARFTATVAGVGRTVSAVAPMVGNAAGLELTISGTAPTSGQSVTVGYSDLSASNDLTGVVQDGTGNDMATMTAPVTAVTFNSTGNVTSLHGSYLNLNLLGSSNINGSGNANANRLVGNSGSNVLDGLSGNDTHTGGAGADTFYFSSAANATTNLDAITDFTSGADKLRFKRSAYPGLSGSSLTNAQFVSGPGLVGATTTSQRFIYDTTSGTLYFDRDGSTATNAPIAVALLGPGTSLVRGDFVLVA